MTGRWGVLRPWHAGVLVGIAYLTASHLPGMFGAVAGTVLPFALLIAATAASDVAGRRSLWRTSVLVRLGELSFAFYMVHQIVIRVLDKSLGGREWTLLPGRSWSS